MKGGRRRAGVLAAVGVVAMVTALPACGGDDSAAVARELRRQSAGADLKVELPEGGVKGNTVELTLSGAGIEIVEPDGDTSGKTGHYAVFVDSEPVAPGAKIPDGERDVIETWEDTVTVTGLTAGSHDVTVVLADGAHRRIGTLPAEVTVPVTGPSLRATAPATTERRQPVVIDVQVRGVTLAPADGSAAEGVGHVDVFVDREPGAAGAAVPVQRGVLHTEGQRISVPDLANGEHELWLVLSTGDEVSFDPMVADKVVVEVGG